jgi:hypothetical protein
MKQYFLILFAALFATDSFAQKSVLSDTSYISNLSGKFYETSETKYDNGEQLRTVTLIGDTAQVQLLYANIANTETRQMAAAVALTNTRNKLNGKIQRLSNTCNTTTGKTIFAYLHQLNESKWIDTTAAQNNPVIITFKDGTISKALVVTKASQNVLKCKIGTDALRTFQLFGEGSIRIIDYPANGQNLYLYNIDNKIFTDYSGSIILTRKSSL